MKPFLALLVVVGLAWGLVRLLDSSAEEGAAPAGLPGEAASPDEAPPASGPDGAGAGAGEPAGPQGGPDGPPPPPGDAGGAPADPDGRAPASPPGASEDPAAAPPPVPAPPREPLGTAEGRVEYDEGPTRVVLFRHPRLFAEIAPRRGAAPPVPDARLVREEPTHRIWEAPATPGAWEAMRAAHAQDPSRRLSPVYFRNPSHHGAGILLPGGITVQFKPELDEDDVQAFAVRHDLKGAKPHPLGPAWWSFDSPPGEAALRLAAEIQATDEVLLAKPEQAERRALK